MKGMKRPVESSHNMGLRSGPRRAASKEGVGHDEQDSGTLDRERGQRFQPDAKKDNECNDGATVDLERDNEPFKVNITAYLVNPLSSTLPFVITTTIIVLLLFQIALSESDKQKPAAECENGLGDLFKQYPQHISFWKAVNVSFKMGTRSDEPGVTLVLHNGDGNLADCLVNRTAAYLSRLIGASKSGEFAYVNGKNAYLPYERDSFLEEILEQRKNLGVLVFNNLEEMDLALVEKLHFICDSDSNINDKSVVFLLLKVQVQDFRDKELADLARKKLGELWEKKLVHDRFIPILGRIANNLGYIDENISTKCP